MSKIQFRKESIKSLLDQGWTRPEIINRFVETEGLSKKYATVFVYTHFGGDAYKTPAHRRKRPVKKPKELIDTSLFDEDIVGSSKNDDLL